MDILSQFFYTICFILIILIIHVLLSLLLLTIFIFCFIQHYFLYNSNAVQYSLMKKNVIIKKVKYVVSWFTVKIINRLKINNNNYNSNVTDNILTLRLICSKRVKS